MAKHCSTGKPAPAESAAVEAVVEELIDTDITPPLLELVLFIFLEPVVRRGKYTL